MAKPVSNSSNTKRGRPALTPEHRMQQLMSLATDLVEERLANKTASAQEVTQILKAGSEVEKLKVEKLEYENQLIKAKIEEIESNKRTEELYERALNAMKRYAGQDDTYE